MFLMENLMFSGARSYEIFQGVMDRVLTPEGSVD